MKKSNNIEIKGTTVHYLFKSHNIAHFLYDTFFHLMYIFETCKNNNIKVGNLMLYIESDDFGAFPPLGLLYVMSYLEKSEPHHELFFKDCVAERVGHKALDEYIEKIKPDIVGMTSFTIGLVDCVLAAQNIRKIVPDAHICLGGHHPIAFPFEAASLPQFNSIVVGEGEIAFTKLVKAIEEKKTFTDITGVYTKESIEK